MEGPVSWVWVCLPNLALQGYRGDNVRCRHGHLERDIWSEIQPKCVSFRFREALAPSIRREEPSVPSSPPAALFSSTAYTDTNHDRCASTSTTHRQTSIVKFSATLHLETRSFVRSTRLSISTSRRHCHLAQCTDPGFVNCRDTLTVQFAHEQLQLRKQLKGLAGETRPSFAPSISRLQRIYYTASSQNTQSLRRHLQDPSKHNHLTCPARHLEFSHHRPSSPLLRLPASVRYHTFYTSPLRRTPPLRYPFERIHRPPFRQPLHHPQRT